jgi:hypothetical protein
MPITAEAKGFTHGAGIVQGIAAFVKILFYQQLAVFDDHDATDIFELVLGYPLVHAHDKLFIISLGRYGPTAIRFDGLYVYVFSFCGGYYYLSSRLWQLYPPL